MSSNPPFKLALAQMLVEGGDAGSNLRRARDRIQAASVQGAQMVLLPEALPSGWTHGAARWQADDGLEGNTCAVLRQAAREFEIFVCSGWLERAGDALYNAALLIDPSGEVLLRHRKLNELEIAQDLYAQGSGLAVADTALGRIGVMICSDAFARGQVIARALAWMGADMIVSPCAWAVPADHDQTREPYGQLWLDHYQPVARDHALWIAGCSNVGTITDGPWKGRHCIGCSLVVDPQGHVAARGTYGVNADEMIFVEVAPVPRTARGDGWNARLGPP